MVTGTHHTPNKYQTHLPKSLPFPSIVLYCELRRVVALLFEHRYVYEKSRSHKHGLFLGRHIGRKGNMISIFQAAAFVFPPGPQRIYHCVDDLACQGGTTRDRILRDGISKHKGYAATLSLVAIAATLDAQSGSTRVGAQPIHLLAGSIEEIVLGNEAAQVADILGFPQNLTRRAILRFQVRQAAKVAKAGHCPKVDATGLFLLVGIDDVRVAVFLRQVVRRVAALARKPIFVFAKDAGGRRPAVLDVFDAAATGRATTQGTTDECAFFVDPAHGIELEGVETGLEVVSFGDHPVDAGLETATTKALRG